MMAMIVLLVCLGSTLFMTGLIWFVQMVHYPLLGLVDRDSFPPYHAEHVRRTGPVVAVAMLAEITTSAVLVMTRPPDVPAWLALAGLMAATVTWVATASVQVPLHHRLSAGFDADLHRRLVRTNWVRTVAWSSHAVIVLVMTAQAIN